MSSASRLIVLPAAALLAACAPGAAPSAATSPAPAARRAILVSFDALNERRMLETVDSAAVPELRALFREGACADGARPAFPSVTAPGHASLWTGAYGDVNGIAANNQPVLPRDEHDLHDWGSGYGAAALRAEPIWIAAARQGLTVFGHHPTQAPHAPGYPSVDGRPDARLDSLRAAAKATLALPRLQVVNGYNMEVSDAVALDERSARPRPAAGWRNLQALASTVPPMEIAWVAGRDSLYALFHGQGAYEAVLVARTRDAAAGVVARPAPVETAPVRGRELARHFSAPLAMPVQGGTVFVRVRLFALAPDLSRFLLFVPALQVVEGNRPEVGAAYAEAVQGWYGNGASWLYTRGRFGPTLAEGGDGTAERRYLETAELSARHFMAGSEWAWRTHRPALQLDYFPLVDEADHALLGLVTPAAPGYDPAVARRVQEIRAAAWSLADLRLAGLRRLVRETPGAALFVSGDHGMRATWRVFRPNVALAAAGLLAADDKGRPDLARTRALTTNGYYVLLNRTARRNGTVPPDEEARVLDAAERALRAARGPDGEPVVTRIWRATSTDTLGMGGPVGGDLYYEVAPGYRFSADVRGPVAEATPRADGGHGYPSVAPDMQTVLCVVGDGIAPRRTSPARTIDAAPTVAEWLGIAPPAHAVGRSRLAELLGRE